MEGKNARRWKYKAGVANNSHHVSSVSYMPRTMLLFLQNPSKVDIIISMFPDGKIRASSLLISGAGIWILLCLNPNVRFLPNFRLPLGTSFSLFPLELCGKSVTLNKWQVNTHLALPCNWNVCNPHSEQVCWVAVTRWCLCPNQRSLSRQRVKCEREKQQRWPSPSSFLN